MTQTVETVDYAAFVRRVLRSFTVRASADPESLALLAAVAEDARVAVNTAARNCHAVGYSYAEIAARLGCTRQSVHERIARQGDPDEAVAS